MTERPTVDRRVAVSDGRADPGARARPHGRSSASRLVVVHHRARSAGTSGWSCPPLVLAGAIVFILNPVVTWLQHRRHPPGRSARPHLPRRRRHHRARPASCRPAGPAARPTSSSERLARAPRTDVEDRDRRPRRAVEGGGLADPDPARRGDSRSQSSGDDRGPSASRSTTVRELGAPGLPRRRSSSSSARSSPSTCWSTCPHLAARWPSR